MSNEKKPLINNNPVLQKYYASLESIVGYRLLLGDTRHFGYYDSAWSFPLPISRSLRAMEGQLFKALNCPKGSKVLDAGCGAGHVALYMAKAGSFDVDCIDVVERHVALAKANVHNAKMDNSIRVRLGDYHHLEHLPDNSFDGIYTMETLVHSTQPLEVLKTFHRLLKPGGHLALNEYDHEDIESSPKDLADCMKIVNKYASMPANASFDKGVLEELVQEAGFIDVRLKDLSEHVVPMLWIFYLIAIIPFLIIRFLGLEHRFVNTIAGVSSYKGRNLWRYIQVTGTKKQ